MANHKVTILRPVVVEGRENVKVGDTVSVDRAQAEKLVALGAARDADGSLSQVNQDAKVQTPKPRNRELAIPGATAQLNCAHLKHDGRKRIDGQITLQLCDSCYDLLRAQNGYAYRVKICMPRTIAQNPGAQVGDTVTISGAHIVEHMLFEGVAKLCKGEEHFFSEIGSPVNRNFIVD